MVGRVHACGESGQSVVPIGPAAGVPLRATPIIGRQSNTRYRHTIASDIHSTAAPFARKWMLDFYHDAIFPRDLKMRRDSEHLLNSLNDRQPAGNLP
ncbi:Berberine/berberine-like domain-containing protein [Burkholderia cepacia]